MPTCCQKHVNFKNSNIYVFEKIMPLNCYFLTGDICLFCYSSCQDLFYVTITVELPLQK